MRNIAMATNQDANELDQLLDIALDDFTNLNLTSIPSGDQVRKFGAEMSNNASEKGKGKQGQMEKESHASEALEELKKQTKEAFQVLDLMEGLNKESGLNENGTVEDFVKQLEEMAGSQDMESIAESMMYQLMSKEVLHEPMKEMGERYPKWLKENKANLKPEEYDRYFDQYKLILQLTDVYEHDSSNFQKIADIIQKMQECGQPPNDIVKEFAPDLDLTNLGELL